MFPQWERESVELIEPLNASAIRDMYFRPDFNVNFLHGVVPRTTIDFLEQFTNTAEYKQTIREREFLVEHAKQYAGLKYPPIFMTADAVVLCAGHILLIKRRAEPGKGLWALPGGYVNAKTDRSVRGAMIRELREETKIKVPVPILLGSIVREQLFDAVDRSPRGRIITMASFIKLEQLELPAVKGSDDAEKAKWVPLADIKAEMMFEDHFDIIFSFIGNV
jgi:bifunctional NMN adenylyltransferase/nudix hydrolase